MEIKLKQGVTVEYGSTGLRATQLSTYVTVCCYLRVICPFQVFHDHTSILFTYTVPTTHCSLYLGFVL